MLWFPAERKLVTQVAWPPETPPVPNVFDPSRNCTEPPGAPALGAPPLVAMTAVNVTDCPMAEGLALLLRVTVTTAGRKTGRGPEELPMKLASPAYTAA